MILTIVTNTKKHIPNQRLLPVAHNDQRILVAVLAGPSHLHQHRVEARANVPRCDAHLLRAARLQIDAAHRRLGFLVVRIAPVAEHMAVQATPAPVPSPEPGHILEHGEEALVIDVDVQLAVHLHVDVAVQRTDGRCLKSRIKQTKKVIKKKND